MSFNSEWRDYKKAIKLTKCNEILCKTILIFTRYPMEQIQDNSCGFKRFNGYIYLHLNLLF